ncbi:MAG: flagellin [Syntrophomonadaceae bacterium]|mgnify:CR=1 FL=1|nr:flagellin [Syntrophomonadaceae bacterium]
MRINHNIAALNTYNRLFINSASSSNSLQKLSSGLQINKAGDDAAGLAISEKMRGQIRGLDQAAKNSQDGISLIQTAEGALSETHSILQRMRELAVQASNDTNTLDDRAAMQKELTELTSEITRIGNNTEFNTKKIINGDMTGPGLGAAQEKITLNFDTGFTLAVAHADVKFKIGGEEYTLKFDEAANAGAAGMAVDSSNKTVTVGIKDVVNQIGTDLAAVLNNLAGALPSSNLAQFDISSTATSISLTAKSTGDFAGADGKNSVSLSSGLLAEKFSEDVVGSDGAGGEAKMQIGANTNQQFTVAIADMRALANLKISGTTAGGNHDVAGAKFTSVALTDNSGSAEYALDISDAGKATAAISVLDNAIKAVSEERSKLGAYQNRLEHTINNLGTSSENLTAAESRIRDVDMAKEMMEFTKTNILSQAATAMLAQANQQPQQVLKLLQ